MKNIHAQIRQLDLDLKIGRCISNIGINKFKFSSPELIDILKYSLVNDKIIKISLEYDETYNLTLVTASKIG